MPTAVDSSRDVCPTTKQKRCILKERDIMLRNGVWRIAIDVEMEPNEEALSVIRRDLLIVGERKQEYTFNSELKLIATVEDFGN